jgi:hypothetical protein
MCWRVARAASASENPSLVVNCCLMRAIGCFFPIEDRFLLKLSS